MSRSTSHLLQSCAIALLLSPAGMYPVVSHAQGSPSSPSSPSLSSESPLPPELEVETPHPDGEPESGESDLQVLPPGSGSLPDLAPEVAPEVAPEALPEAAPEAAPDRELIEGEGGEEPLIEAAPAELLPTGEGVDRGTGFRVKGYVRGEHRYNRPNVYYGYDPIIGLWTPRGSPYAAFGLTPTVSHDAYLETNFEIAWRRYDFVSAYTDASFIVSTSHAEQSVFEQVQDLLIGTGDVDAGAGSSSGVPIPGAAGSQLARRERERVLINELYLSPELQGWGSLTVGKRRVSWGSAFTWSPMDVINPPRNPLEPTLQREGSYAAILDVTRFERVAVSLLYKPYITEDLRGLPSEWDRDRNLLVGRLFMNVLESDLNLAYYNNQGRSYAGLSFSRYFDVIEAHVEGLAQHGRPTWLVREVDRTNDSAGAYQAPYEVGQLELDNGRWYADLLLGARYNFEDSSAVLLEYLYHGAGYNQAEYDLYRGITAYMQEELPHLATRLIDSGLSEEQQQEVSQSWEQLLGSAPYVYSEQNPRKHYLGATFVKSKMFGLIEPKISAILNLDDFSGTLYPSIDFVLSRDSSARGVVRFLAGALIFFGGDDSQAAYYPNKFSANLRMTAYF